MALAQKLTYRSMEQKGKARSKFMHWWSGNLLQSRQVYTIRKRQSFYQVLRSWTVQFSRSAVSNFHDPVFTACQASLSITNSQSLLKLMSIESVMPSSHLILCRPLILLPPASGTFPMSQLFAWGGQSIGVSALASVLPMNTQNWSPLGWTITQP